MKPLTRIATTLLWTAITALSSLTAPTIFATQLTVESRSPVTPGLWWNSARGGNGFDIYPIRDQLFIVWYTYDRSGKAVWYTAQGTLIDGKLKADWYKHRWEYAKNRAVGRISESAKAGSLEVVIKTPANVELVFNIDGVDGKWNLTPYQVSGVTADKDRSGLWWNPNRSGYGWSIKEHQDTAITVLYAYDPSGEPIWMIGSRETGKNVTDPIKLATYRGACPTCTQVTPTIVNETSFNYSFSADSSALTVNLNAPQLGAEFQERSDLAVFSASSRAADNQLATFQDEATIKRYIATGLVFPTRSTTPILLPSPAPPSTTAAFSGVNTQESNVDEAARLRSDGQYFYGVDSQKQIIRVGQRVADAFAVRNELRVADGVKLRGGELTSGGVFITSDKLVSVASSKSYGFGLGLPSPIWPYPGNWVNGQTVVEVFDRSVPSNPKRSYVADIEGFLVGTRRIGDQLYVVTRAARNANTIQLTAPLPASNEQRLLALSQAPLDKLLPTISINNGQPQPQVEMSQIFAPPQGGQSPQSDIVTIMRFPINAPEQRESIAIMGSTASIYVSEKNLYVGSTRYDWTTTVDGHPKFFSTTDIHQIALGTTGLKIVGTGSIEGALDSKIDRAPFRFSELDGKLRVVTSAPTQWGTLGQNRLTILEPSTTPGVLRTLSYLPNSKRPATIGKPNEQLYATRFLGDKLYAVTFKKIDPLYIIDVSNPAEPAVKGEVELPGFSDYLHPISKDLLLGVGLAAVAAQNSTGDANFAWFQGVQLSLFDVSNPSAPKVLQLVEMGKRGSRTEVLNHHHGFSSLTKEGYVDMAIPAQIAEPDSTYPYNSNPSSYYNVQEAGLFRFRIDTSAGTAAARLIAQAPLITYRKSVATTQSYTIEGSRSVLFDDMQVYFERGQYWVKGASAGAPIGPL